LPPPVPVELPVPVESSCRRAELPEPPSLLPPLPLVLSLGVLDPLEVEATSPLVLESGLEGEPHEHAVPAMANDRSPRVATS